MMQPGIIVAIYAALIIALSIAALAFLLIEAMAESSFTKAALVIALSLLLFLSVTRALAAPLDQDEPPPTPTPVYSEEAGNGVILPPTPTPRSIDLCRPNGQPPIGWGTVTPSPYWYANCGRCAPSPYDHPTPTPTPTLPPTVTVTPTPTPVPVVTVGLSHNRCSTWITLTEALSSSLEFSKTSSFGNYAPNPTWYLCGLGTEEGSWPRDGMTLTVWLQASIDARTQRGAPRKRVFLLGDGDSPVIDETGQGLTILGWREVTIFLPYNPHYRNRASLIGLRVDARPPATSTHTVRVRLSPPSVPTPTLTPTPTPTPTPDTVTGTYCWEVHGNEEWDDYGTGYDGHGWLPNFTVGDAKCYDVPLPGGMPGIPVSLGICLVPVNFGTWDFGFIRLNLDYLVAAAIVMLSIKWLKGD